MKMQMGKPAAVSETDQELIELLVPKLDRGVNFILVPKEDPALGKSLKNEVLSVFLHQARSVTTVSFETDGAVRRDEGVRYADGIVQSAHVTDWRYAILVNEARRGDNSSKTVTTCYIRDRNVFVGVRHALGLPAF